MGNVGLNFGGVDPKKNNFKDFTKKNFSPKKITSAVKKFNIRSQKSFLKNGFVKTNFNIKKHKTSKNNNLCVK